ncbi:hypothetical protein A7X89_06355 [Stenotrophomonas maltophilia]|nr:hypothetical protein A7X89_06355 [Stenotrophomonas maltophilia]
MNVLRAFTRPLVFLSAQHACAVVERQDIPAWRLAQHATPMCVISILFGTFSLAQAISEIEPEGLSIARGEIALHVISQPHGGCTIGRLHIGKTIVAVIPVDVVFHSG